MQLDGTQNETGVHAACLQSAGTERRLHGTLFPGQMEMGKIEMGLPSPRIFKKTTGQE